MTTNRYQTSEGQKRDHHVIFCDHTNIAIKGIKAELKSVQFLLDGLRVERVGDYRILVNYNMLDRDGNANEVDMLLINRLGIFLIEVKDWRGRIDAYEREWECRGQTRKNPLLLIERKAKTFHSQLFGPGGSLAHLGGTSVTGLVVLVQGLASFFAHGHDNLQKILALDENLLDALSTTRLSFRRANTRRLSDEEIKNVCASLYSRHQRRQTKIHNYRIIKDLDTRSDQCITFEAENIYLTSQHMRLKRYELPSLDPAIMEQSIRQFQRSIQAVRSLGWHPHILHSETFFADDIDYQQDVFYEITELPTGLDLGQMMRERARQGRRMPFAQQVSFVRAICLALQHAHNHQIQGKPSPVYHRNICPETVFRMQDGTIKLGDFDFAKLNDATISVPGQALVAKIYTAPELLQNSSLASPRSDIYALGVLWYCMASLPTRIKHFEPGRINTLDLPEEVRALLKRMTAEAPAQRPEKVEHILEAIASYQEE